MSRSQRPIPPGNLSALLIEAGRSETAPDRSVRRALGTAKTAIFLSTTTGVASASSWALGAVGVWGKAFGIGVVAGGLTLLAGHAVTHHRNFDGEPPRAAMSESGFVRGMSTAPPVKVGEALESPEPTIQSDQAAMQTTSPTEDQTPKPAHPPVTPTTPHAERGVAPHTIDSDEAPQTAQETREGAQAASPRKSDELALELAIADHARARLAAGNATAALAAIEQYQANYPQGRLAEETEVLRIEALVAAGRREEARTLATQFLKVYPRSVLSQRVRSVSGFQ